MSSPISKSLSLKSYHSGKLTFGKMAKVQVITHLIMRWRDGCESSQRRPVPLTAIAAGANWEAMPPLEP